MNRYEWIRPYMTCMNWKNHAWIFLDAVEHEISIAANYFERKNIFQPIYFIICEKCGMHGVIRNFYLILTNDKLEKLTCEEYLIKNIVE